MILIKNAYLVSMSDINYEVTDILIKDGKINKIGNLKESDYNCQVIDAKENWVTPGFIEPHSHMGISEQGIGFEGRDHNESTNPSTPDMKGSDAIYPYDTAFKDAIESGFTAVSTGPGSGNVIGGTFCVIKTIGNSVEEMLIKDDIAMKMALGENPKRFYSTKDKTPSTRMGSASVLRSELNKAKEYKEAVERYKMGEGKKPDFDSKKYSLARVFDGMLCKIHAHRTDDIQTAIRIAKEFDLNFTIEHSSESHLIIEYMLKSNVKSIVGPIMMSRTKYESRNKTLRTPALLEKAGLEFAITTDHPVIPIIAARAQVGLMIREGLSELGALKALTINAAKLNSVDDRIGSIEVGKDADIVIWNAYPFDIMSKPDTVIIDGKIIEL
ncbi:amidohydrolase [Mycoplasmatota bacterium]|nr:amidohydrolase [Mycoplasmatota bacterium]